MLPQLKAMAMKEVEEHLRHRPTVGRTLTGDGVTKGVPLINFLVHVPGKGVKLLAITDCTGHMSEGGTKNALYVFVALAYACTVIYKIRIVCASLLCVNSVMYRTYLELLN